MRKTAKIGRYNVTLKRGFVWSRVTVWKDVWPALGGVIATNRFRNSEADEKWRQALRILSEENPGIPIGVEDEGD